MCDTTTLSAEFTAEAAKPIAEQGLSQQAIRRIVTPSCLATYVHG